MLANQLSTGAVSGFIYRYLTDNPDGMWAPMKDEIAKRLSDISKSSFAMMRQIKQKASESVKLYAERLISLAEIGFIDYDNPAGQLQLLDLFVSGLINDQLKMTILRKKPVVIEQALCITMDEYVRLRVAIRSTRQYGHEPVDTSHLRNPKCFKCKKFGHKADECRVRVKTVGRKLVCWGCGCEGHVLRICMQKDNMPPVGHGRPFNRGEVRPSKQEK